MAKQSSTQKELAQLERRLTELEGNSASGGQVETQISELKQQVTALREELVGTRGV
ncbi:MAG: hypothetical protein IH916_10330, partial [Acidobacteria bacterium]|nr:hypothetical protein [Acidobacteriota bacterium]